MANDVADPQLAGCDVDAVEPRDPVEADEDPGRATRAFIRGTRL